MPSVIYVAKRDLMTGHTLGTVYGKNFFVDQNDRLPKRKATEHKAIDGTVETVFAHRSIEWRIKSPPTPIDQLDQWREFAASVADGTPFIYDPYGDSAIPVQQTNVVIVGDVKESRHSDFGYAIISFTVLEQ